MKTSLRNKCIAFLLTGMLAVTFATPGFAEVKGTEAPVPDAAAAASDLGAVIDDVDDVGAPADTDADADADAVADQQLTEEEPQLTVMSGDETDPNGTDPNGTELEIPVNTWITENGKTYYAGADGNYVTGLQTISGVTYYFDGSGIMQTGWKTIGSSRYYFDGSGVMQTGWKTIGSSRYYFNGSGVMQTGWKTISSSKCYFDGSGVMQTGWKTISSKTYYFNNSGVMKTGWLKLSGKKYYLTKAGVRVTGWKTLSKKKYFFSKSGVMATGWKTIEGCKYYFAKSGIMQKGFKKIKGSYYYFDSEGIMADFGIYKKKWMISYTGKCYKIPKATKNKKKSEARMANLIAKCSGKSCKKMKDIEKVGRASAYIELLYSSCRYSMKGSNYNRPYGVFYAKVASCAGTTRALGLVLTKMGFKWKHVNENKYKHQWCTLKMDGKKGWADGMIGFVGYGKAPF